LRNVNDSFVNNFTLVSVGEEWFMLLRSV
jgi:hypothetical protein